MFSVFDMHPTQDTAKTSLSILVVLFSNQQQSIEKSVIDDFQVDFVVDVGPKISGLVIDSWQHRKLFVLIEFL